MFFRSLKFRAGARQIQFRRGPDHGVAMFSSARMTQLEVVMGIWRKSVPSGVAIVHKVNVRTTALESIHVNIYKIFYCFLLVSMSISFVAETQQPNFMLIFLYLFFMLVDLSC